MFEYNSEVTILPVVSSMDGMVWTSEPSVGSEYQFCVDANGDLFLYTKIDPLAEMKAKFAKLKAKFVQCH